MDGLPPSIRGQVPLYPPRSGIRSETHARERERERIEIKMMGSPNENAGFKPMTPQDMKMVDKVFTDYIAKSYGDENDARMKTITYLRRVLGWDEHFARRAASIAIEDGQTHKSQVLKDKEMK